MSLQNQIRAWLILLGVAILALWLFRGILLPFVLGMALAYMLDPVADQFEKWGVRRTLATAIIMILAALVAIGALLLVVPVLLQQAVGLVQRLPGYATQLRTLAEQWAPEFIESLNLDAFFGIESGGQLESTLSDLFSQVLVFVGNLTAQIMQSGLALINAVSILVVTPVVAFYLLLDWDRMVKAFDDLLPVRYKDDIRQVFTDIDRSMAGVIRGQGSVILLLSLFYALSLSIAGLNFGAAIGLISGIFSFIPYVGFLIGFFLSMGIAIVQFWPDPVMVGVILVIFFIGQFLEGNVLYPKLVGSSIGVHPVWLMFALFAFGLVFGFVGVLLAVPLAAMAGVLTRFAVTKYKDSALYQGDDAAGAGNQAAPEDDK